jgi:hypothetical protein
MSACHSPTSERRRACVRFVPLRDIEIVGIQNFASNQRTHPGSQIIRSRDTPPAAVA